jgi:hypothetical protein
VAGEAGDANWWAWGHSNGRHSQKRFKPSPNSNGLKMFKKIQTLIDQNLTFPSSKNLK